MLRKIVIRNPNPALKIWIPDNLCKNRRISDPSLIIKIPFKKNTEQNIKTLDIILDLSVMPSSRKDER